jgi:hypothetical protein
MWNALPAQEISNNPTGKRAWNSDLESLNPEVHPVPEGSSGHVPSFNPLQPNPTRQDWDREPETCSNRYSGEAMKKPADWPKHYDYESAEPD